MKFKDILDSIPTKDLQNPAELFKKIGYIPKLIAELGIGYPYMACSIPFIKGGIETILVEANPRLCYCFSMGFNKDFPDDISPKILFKDSWPNISPPPYDYNGYSFSKNCHIYNIAITDIDKEVLVIEDNDSSFVKDSTPLTSISIAKNTVQYKVNGYRFCHIDPGFIDCLFMDIQGCEWFALKNMVSRPYFIILEYIFDDSHYNPYIEQISTWMQYNNYLPIAKDHSDILYVKEMGKYEI